MVTQTWARDAKIQQNRGEMIEMWAALQFLLLCESKFGTIISHLDEIA